jgi:hypothetical protein
MVKLILLKNQLLIIIKMKKIIIVLMLSLVIVNAHSQSLLNGRNRVAPKKGAIQASVSKSETPKSLYFFENFQTGTMSSTYTILNVDGNSLPPTDMPLLTQAWVVATGDGISSTNSCAFSSGWQANTTANDWMILPKQTITNGTYLKWKSMVYFGGGTSQIYEVRIAKTIAGTTPAPSDFVNVAIDSITETAYTWQQHSVDIDALGYANCDIWVAFRNVSPGTTDPYETDILFIDDISISNPVNVDAAVLEINTPFINGMTLPIGGVLRNEGVQNITSFDFSYDINGANVSTVEHVGGIDITMNDTISFIHSVPFVFSATNDYTINLKVFNVNGTTDGDTINNKLSKRIIIGEDNSTPKMPLFEYFGSNDLPMGEGGFYDVYATAMTNFNTNYFDNGANYPKATFISYQQSPDTYSIPECATRYDYYHVSSNPAIYTDSKEDLTFSDLDYLDELNQRPAFFNINTTKTVVGDSVVVNVTINPFATVNAKLHVAVVEKVTTGNLGAAQVTAYKNVLMKMATGGNGSDVSLTNGVPVTLVYKVCMSGTHVEQMDDLLAVVFLQDSASKYVYQSAKSEINNSVEDVQSADMIQVCPNPSNGKVAVSNIKNGKVEVYNQIGDKVFETENDNNTCSVDLSNHPSGCYIIRIITNGSVVSKKLIIQK